MADDKTITTDQEAAQQTDSNDQESGYIKLPLGRASALLPSGKSIKLTSVNIGGVPVLAGGPPGVVRPGDEIAIAAENGGLAVFNFVEFLSQGNPVDPESDSIKATDTKIIARLPQNAGEVIGEGVPVKILLIGPNDEAEVGKTLIFLAAAKDAEADEKAKQAKARQKEAEEMQRLSAQPGFVQGTLNAMGQVPEDAASVVTGGLLKSLPKTQMREAVAKGDRNKVKELAQAAQKSGDVKFLQETLQSTSDPVLKNILQTSLSAAVQVQSQKKEERQLKQSGRVEASVINRQASGGGAAQLNVDDDAEVSVNSQVNSGVEVKQKVETATVNISQPQSAAAEVQTGGQSATVNTTGSAQTNVQYTNQASGQVSASGQVTGSANTEANVNASAKVESTSQTQAQVNARQEVSEQSNVMQPQSLEAEAEVSAKSQTSVQSPAAKPQNPDVKINLEEKLKSDARNRVVLGEPEDVAKLIERGEKQVKAQAPVQKSEENKPDRITEPPLAVEAAETEKPPVAEKEEVGVSAQTTSKEQSQPQNLQEPATALKIQGETEAETKAPEGLKQFKQNEDKLNERLGLKLVPSTPGDVSKPPAGLPPKRKGPIRRGLEKAGRAGLMAATLARPMAAGDSVGAPVEKTTASQSALPQRPGQEAGQGQNAPAGEAGVTEQEPSRPENENIEEESLKEQSPVEGGQVEQQEQEPSESTPAENLLEENSKNLAKQQKQTAEVTKAAGAVQKAFDALLMEGVGWVWAAALPTLGLSFIAGALVGDILFLLKNWLIEKAVGKLNLSQHAQASLSSIARNIKISAKVKVNILIWHFIVAVGVIAVFCGIVYVGCNTPVGKQIDPVGYKLTYLGLSGYSNICEQMEKIVGGGSASTTQASVSSSQTPPSGSVPFVTPTSPSTQQNGALNAR